MVVVKAVYTYFVLSVYMVRLYSLYTSHIPPLYPHVYLKLNGSYDLLGLGKYERM